MRERDDIMPIKKKLPLFIVLLVAIPIFLLAIIYYPYVSRQMIALNKEKIHQVLTMEGKYLQSFFKERELESGYLTISPEVHKWAQGQEGYDMDNLNQFFEKEKRDNPYLRDLFIVNLAGKVIASSNPKSMGLDLADREYVQVGLLGETTISNLLQDRVEGESVIIVASPIQNYQDNIIGIMGNVIETPKLSINFFNLVAPDVGSAYLVDGNGCIIFHSNKERIGKNHPNPLVEQYLRDIELHDGYISEEIYTNNEQIFLAHQQIVGTPWMLVIEQDMEIVMLSARKAFVVIVALGMLILVAAGILGYYYAMGLVNPLSEVIEVMNRTSKGEVDIRIQYKRNDELGQLADDFNYMLDKLVGAYEEVADNKKKLLDAENELRHVALSDQLTELPNRMAMLMELDKCIQAYRQRSEHFVLVLLDIDQFKRLNDTLGHATGDQILVEVARRLKSKIHLAYRLSGDEFALIILDQYKIKTLEATIKNLQSVVNVPHRVFDKEILVTMSMGVSVYPHNGETPEQLTQNADTAMDIAKKAGKGQVVFFSKIMRETVLRRVQVEQVLKKSISEGLVYLDFQPKYNVNNRTLCGFEALMRLTSDTGEPLSPEEFIPIAEEIGMIEELGEWALEFVFKKIDAWFKQGYAIGHVGVNVSGHQLTQKRFLDYFTDMVTQYGTLVKFVELEITESVLIENTAEMLQTLLQLRNMGYQIALDDFGTGYSAFNYLRTIPLTALKIDKTFIDPIGINLKAEALVKTIIDIAHEMNLKVVAEGVETELQYQSLRRASCDIIQGYYFSKPLSVEESENLLENIKNM